MADEMIHDLQIVGLPASFVLASLAGQPNYDLNGRPFVNDTIVGLYLRHWG